MAESSEVYWLVAPADEMALDNGGKFWKELIHQGRWTNTRAGFTLQVDHGRLEKWKRSFDEMRGAGIRVPVPWGHSYDPRANAGFLEELELRDSGLWGLLNVPNEEDAARLGKTVAGVSVSINPNFTDGAGREWGEVIEHVALTNHPVVTEQGDFIQAGTQSDEEKRAITLQLDTAEDSPDLEAVRQEFGIQGELNRHNFVDAIKVKFDQLKSELENCKGELIELRAIHLDQADEGGEDAEDGAPADDERASDLNNRL